MCSTVMFVAGINVFYCDDCAEIDAADLCVAHDTTKRLMSSPKCRSVEVINNPARPGSNHREVNCINYR